MYTNDRAVHVYRCMLWHCLDRVHWPRMRIDDRSAPSGRFVARVSTAVTTVDRRPGRGAIFRPPTPLSLRFLPCPLRAARALQEPPLPRRLSPSMLLPRRALHRESIPPRSPIRPRPPFRRLTTWRLGLPCRLRAASLLERADKQPVPLALHRLLFIMVSGPAGPLVHPQGVLTPRRESHGRDRLWPSLRPLLLPPRLPRRYTCRPAATAEPVGTPLSRLPPPPDVPSATTADLDTLGDALKYSSGIPSRAIRTLTGRGSNRPSLRATPPRATSFLAGHPYQPTSCRVFLRISAPPFRRFRSLL